MMDRYALLVDGREVGRWPTRLQAQTCALEKGLVIDAGSDFPGDPAGRWLRPGVAIVEMEEE